MTTLLGYPLADLDSSGGGHTAREIAQQPDLWREISTARVTSCQGDEAFLRRLLDRAELRIVLTGAGSSAFTGQVLAPGLARSLHRRVDAVATTDIVSTPHEQLAEDVPTLLVSFARSGDSPESVAATELAEQQLSECWHLVVTCNADGQLAREHASRSRSEVLLLPEAANDRGFAMTSSFTGMILAAMQSLGGAPDDQLVQRIAGAAEQLLVTHASDVRALAEREPNRIVYLGSGSFKGLAAESALKTLELTAGGVVALSDSALGFRHGPKSVLDERTLVLVYLSNDPYTRQYDLDILDELRRTVPAGSLVAISADGDEAAEREETWTLPGLQDVPDTTLALPAVICAQLIALALSLSRGCTPDNPFPSGDVNRVVQGVQLHPLRS
jgi:tagatose-6-phosphate ketose/aldose isomerase